MRSSETEVTTTNQHADRIGAAFEPHEYEWVADPRNPDIRVAVDAPACKTCAAEADLEALRVRAAAADQLANALRAIRETPYGKFDSKGDYAAFVRDLCDSALAVFDAAAADRDNTLKCGTTDCILNAPHSGPHLNSDGHTFFLAGGAS